MRSWRLIFYKLGNGAVIMFPIRYIPLAVLSLSLAVSTLLPQYAVAQSVNYDYEISGETCIGRNTNSEVGKSLRRVNGSLKNIHEELTATVYCPIVLPRLETNTSGPGFKYHLRTIGAQVVFISNNPPIQEVVCGLSILNWLGMIVANKRGEGFLGPVEGGPGSSWSAYLAFVEMEFTEQDALDPSKGSRFTVKCGLPPLSELTQVFVHTNYYKTEDDPQ
jgi:hypothetical protein